MRKTLLGAMAATLLAGSGVQAQDEMYMTPTWNRFELGVYQGLAWSSPWATLATRPGIGNEDVGPGLAPMWGGIGNFFFGPSFGLRLHYGYMPSHVINPEFAFPDNYPLNNHFYDLSVVFRPFLARGPGLMGSAYVFLGGGGLTANYADGQNTCPQGGVVRGALQTRGVLLYCDRNPSTVGQGTAGIGADIFSLFGLGFFGEAAVHGYDSPMHVPNTTGGAEDKFAFTPNIKLGLKFGFGPVAPPAPPPPPPPPPPPAIEEPVAPTENAIRVCILEGGQLREVDAMVNSATGDTMVTMAGERRRFAEAYPATTGYAAGADFFLQDRPIRLNNRNYVRFGLTRIIPATDVRSIGTFQGTTLFAETGANAQNPDVVYVLVRPGCEFQPYQRETVTRVRG